MTDVWLTINDRDFGGWTELTVERAVSWATTEFQIGATRNWPGNAREWDIAMGDAVELRFDDVLILTGWLDGMDIKYDATSHKIELRGRGLTSDLVDCSYLGPPTEWKNTDPAQIITAIAAQHPNVKVQFDTDLGDPLDFKVQQGEACWDAIERITRLRQLIVYEMPDGSLLITRVSEEYCDTPLVQGDNILSADANLHDRDRFSIYIVKGQGSGGDATNAKQAAQVVAQTEDESVRRFRPKIIVQSAKTDTATAQRRAEWEKQQAWGNGRSVGIVVQGWLMPNGEQWPLNRLVRIEDAWLGLDREMSIAGLRYSLGREGTRTSLTLQPPESLTPEPEDLDKKTTDGASAKGGEGTASFWDQVAADRQAGERRRLSGSE